MATDDASKLFVAGMPDSITEDTLREIFEATGARVVNVSLPKDRMTGRPRGFGFVTLSSPEEASSAKGALDGSTHAGRQISVRPFTAGPQKRGEPKPDLAAQSDRTLYVGNLPFDLSQGDIEQLFDEQDLGPVVRVHLPSGPDGRPRGFGFVTLGSADAARKAVDVLSSTDVKGRRLQVNLAHAKGDRRERGPAIERSPRPPHVRDGAPGPSSADSPPSISAPGEGGMFGPERPAEPRRSKEKPEAKRRKRDRGKRRTERDEFHKRERGGGSNWNKWNRDWDDD